MQGAISNLTRVGFVVENASNNSLKVVPKAGMTVTVKAGSAWFDNQKITLSSDTDQVVATADGALDRIDIIHMDSSANVQYTAGTAHASPAPPRLTDGNFILAEIAVAAADGSMDLADITDLRDTNKVTVDIPITPTLETDDLAQSADTERTTMSLTYVKLKEIAVSHPGTLRIKFDLGRDSSGSTGFGRIYRNGVAVGTEQSEASSYATYSEDIASWSADDLIQIYAKNNAGTPKWTKIRNFQIYCMLLPETTVNTD